MLKLLLCLCFFLCPDIEPPQVLTNLGSLNGKWMQSREGKQYLAFYGIPYAKPPVGQLRFEDPVEFGRWDGVRDATEPKAPCIQWLHLAPGNQNITGSEDCLYLNIYTPDTRYGSLLPVMVYFHGGAYEFGDSVTGRGAGYWMDERVVIVTVAYRLAALGFMSFENELMPGNYGLKDQLLALKWVRQNIPAFGGHPKKITIMGESAGGTSAYFHVVSPRSRGLFQYAISQSGSIFAPWAWTRPGIARERAQRTADILGCNLTTTRESIECLKTKPAYSIIDARKNFMNKYKDPIVFYSPVIDKAARKPFLPQDPSELEPANVPLMTGINSGDGMLRTSSYSVLPFFDWSEIDRNFTKFINEAVFVSDPKGMERGVDEIRSFYFDDMPLDDNSYPNLTNLFTDSFFSYPALQTIRKHSGPVYLYYFNYLGERSFADLGFRRVINASWHTDEVIYLWDLKGIFPPLRGDDLSMSRSLIKLWTNFAKYGFPTTKDSVIDWGEYDKNNRYFHIHNGGFSLESSLLEERNNFWMKYLMGT